VTNVMVPSTFGLDLDAIDELVRLARSGVAYRQLAAYARCALSTVRDGPRFLDRLVRWGAVTLPGWRACEEDASESWS
jgi:hypothetical protein